MPAGFVRCQKNGGRIRTVSGPSKEHGLSAGQYVHFCFLGGKSFRGEVKARKGEKTAEKAYSKRAKKLGVNVGD